MRTWPIGARKNRTHLFVMCMMADHYDNIWLGIEDEGVIKFDSRTEQFERIDLGYAAPDIRSFYEDRDGTVWIGSEFGLFSYKEGIIRKEKYIGKRVASGMARTANGVLLVGTIGGGLFVFDKKGERPRRLYVDNGLPSNRINHLLLDRERVLWLASHRGLIYVKDIRHLEQFEVFDHRQGLSDNHICAILQDWMGHIWVSTYTGISCFDPQKKRFFTNITHELRTPLTLILGPLEDLMNDRRMPEPYHRKVGLINKSAERLRNLVNEILEFRKTETQNRRLTVAKGDLGALVTEIGESYKQLNRNPKTAISVTVQHDVPPVYFDSEVITTVLNNFLSNAVKYTPEGRISVTLADDGKGHVNLAVQDTGYGIRKEALPHIFDRYYQTDGKHQAEGTGIGLALVKSLADLHEAMLTVESEEGKGSTFTFSLLTDNSYPGALHKEDKPQEDTGRGDGSPEEGLTETESDEQPLLLVVEDNDDIRQYIAESMGEDFRVIQAADGREGTALAAEQMPDIIVSDIMMPRMNGIELTRRVKEDIRTCHIPVILLTAKDSVEDKEEGYDCGADSYLTKPFSARLLQSRIHNLLSSRRRLAELTAFRLAGKQEMQPPETDVPALNRLDREFLDKMNQVIEEHITTEDLNMDFMSDKMAMSYSTFYRKVKALTGMTAKEYILKRRLYHCAKLLQCGDYNVIEAATMTGFNDQNNFRLVFKKEFGITPSAYIKQSK